MLGCLGCCSSNSDTMAEGLTRWIDGSDESEKSNRVKAAKLILEAYQTSTHSLSLSGLELTSLPEEIGGVTKLREFRLAKNYLPETESKKLPNRFQADGVGPQKGPEEWEQEKQTNQERLIDLNGSLESLSREEDQYREAQVDTESQALQLNILPREMLDKITEGAEDAAKLGKASKFNRAVCPNSRVRLLW